MPECSCHILAVRGRYVVVKWVIGLHGADKMCSLVVVSCEEMLEGRPTERPSQAKGGWRESGTGLHSFIVLARGVEQQLPLSLDIVSGMHNRSRLFQCTEIGKRQSMSILRAGRFRPRTALMRSPRPTA